MSRKDEKCGSSEAGGFWKSAYCTEPRVEAVRCASRLSHCLDAQDSDSPLWVTH